MMHLNSALLCIVVNPKHFTIMWGGVSPQPPPVCSIHLDDATAATGQPHQCARHTPATGAEERESIEPIKWKRSPHTSYRWRGERVIEPIKWMRSPHTSYRWRGERVKEPIKWMRSPHTSYRCRGERVIEPIKCMRSPHTSYRWREERESYSQSSACAHYTPATGGEESESHRANQVDALTTHQLQVERRES